MCRYCSEVFVTWLCADTVVKCFLPGCVQTPLHLAVKLSSLPAIQMLLEAGADPNLVDSTGLTSTHMAVQGHDLDCLEALLQWGKFPCDLNYRNFEGWEDMLDIIMMIMDRSCAGQLF